MILYASAKGKSALAPEIGKSHATYAFLKYLKAYTSTKIDLRRYLEDWPFHLGDKTSTMWGAISLEIPFKPLEVKAPMRYMENYFSYEPFAKKILWEGEGSE